MNVYPDLYLNSVIDINPTLLKKNKLEALILDVDNTLIDYYKNLIDGAEDWCENLKSEGIKCIILSNSNKKEKVETVAKKLGIKYVMFAKKPLKSGFKKALEKLEMKPEQVAVVGDQIFTDIMGANLTGIRSILVAPIDPHEEIQIVLKRFIEKPVIACYKRHLKKVNK